MCQIESWNDPHMPAEPHHRHPKQETRFWVLSGQLAFQISDETIYANAGETAVVPPNTPHHFWNDGDEVAHHMQEFRPAMKIDKFFETLFGLARENKLNERGTPNLLQLAVMLPVYRNEMRPMKPPWPILLPLAILLYPFAYARGYRATYPQYHHGDTEAPPATAPVDTGKA